MATKETRRLLRVFPDRHGSYKTVPITASSTAGDLRDIIAKKFLLTAEEADDYVILLLVRRRPQWRREAAPPTSAHTKAASTSTASHELTLRLRRNWDGARTLKPHENLMDIIQEDRRLRWPGRPEPESAANTGSATHHQGFDNNEFLMFIFKNGRIPLDVGNEFCGSSGEDGEEDDEDDEDDDGDEGARERKRRESTEGGGSAATTKVQQPHGSHHHRHHHRHHPQQSTPPPMANGHCKGTSTCERFVLGLPLDPQRRLSYQPRRPSNWNASANNWSPENLVDVTMYGVNDDGGTLPMHNAMMAAAAHNNTTTTMLTGGFSGYLLRRSQLQELVWYRRWCVIREDTLWWCKSRHNQRHIIKIPLTNIDVKISPDARTNRSMRYCFEVEVNTTGRVYLFRARDSNERDLWLRALTEHIHVCHQNERVKLAEVIVSDQEYRASQLNEGRLDRVTASLAGLLKDDEARHIFAQCMCEWHCEESLYFYCDVEDWRVFAKQLNADMQAMHDVPKEGKDGSSGSDGVSTSGVGGSSGVEDSSGADATALSNAAPIPAGSVDDNTQTSFRIGSSRFQASVSALWEQREHRREQHSFRARILELWDRAQAIYDMFMNSETAEFEVLIEISEKEKVRHILEQYHHDRSKDATDSSSDAQDVAEESADSSGVHQRQRQRLLPPPLDLFGTVQEKVMEDMRKGAYQRLIGSSEGRRRLALLSVHDP